MRVILRDFDENYFKSDFLLGGVMGVILLPWLMNKIGRKLTMLLMVPPLTLGWLLLIFLDPLFYYSSLLLGFFGSVLYVLVPIYVTEISETKNRGYIKFN